MVVFTHSRSCQSIRARVLFVTSDISIVHDEERTDQKRGETVEFVVSHIRHRIVEGRFVSGQRLIARDLCEDLGLSRGPIREAFRRLAADGIVELTPNRGATVRQLSRKQVKNVFQIRESLEGLAARLAAEHIDEGTNRRLFADVWEKVQPTLTPLPWQIFIQQNRLYHATIVSISGNEQLRACLRNGI